MINGKNILCVVPARGGSKGIPFKNLKKIKNTPLVILAAELARQIKEIDQIFVSTDSEKIASICRKAGFDIPFLRPSHLSGDRVSDHEVLKHALESYEKLLKDKFDYILMLQPTSPLRKIKTIKETIKKISEGEHDSVWTVSESDLKFHPDKQLVIDKDRIKFFSKRGQTIIARQQLTPTFYRNGIAYAFTRDLLMNSNNIMGNKCGYLVVDYPNISIDTEDDLLKARQLFNKF